MSLFEINGEPWGRLKEEHLFADFPGWSSSTQAAAIRELQGVPADVLGARTRSGITARLLERASWPTLADATIVSYFVLRMREYEQHGAAADAVRPDIIEALCDKLALQPESAPSSTTEAHPLVAAVGYVDFDNPTGWRSGLPFGSVYVE